MLSYYAAMKAKTSCVVAEVC